MPVVATSHDQSAPPKLDFPTMGFLMLSPLIGIVGTAVYTYIYGFQLWMLVLFLAMYTAVGLSICAGYHRFFSHKSYEASRPVQIFFAIFGAMAAQNAVIWWTGNHRLHHQHIDKDWDPYNIKRGFWWAHILWIFYHHPTPDAETLAPDLLKNPVVRWQTKWYRTVLIVGGFGLPALIGWMFGDAIAGLLWGGFLRIVVIHHTTFFVNSLAHYFGKQTYNAEVSARDNWGVALLTLGEGYHSFHHRFPADFRNGIRWYHWDPAKWFIATLKATGLASNLRSATPPQVAQARMLAEVKEIEGRLANSQGETADKARALLSDARGHIDAALGLWQQHVHEQNEKASSAWRDARRKAHRHIREARRRWTAARSMASRLPARA